jgi:hypothetical protein
MKRFYLCLFGVALLVSCGHKQPPIEKLYEDGVEIVLNHAQPFRPKGAPGSLHLEQELTIDTERADLVENGVVDIWGFEVNSQGDIYIFQPPMSVGKFISKFDASGRFLASFAPKGQGPGEIQWPIFLKITANDDLSLMDMMTKKLLVFDEDGAVLRMMEVPLDIKGSSLLLQLPNGNHLYRKIEWELSKANPGLVMIYCLTDREFRDIQELDRVVFPHPFGVSRIRIPYPITCWTVTRDRIYMGNPDKGYEIRVYDLNGNLVRKIRKEFLAVPFPESKKRGVLKALDSPQLAPLKSKLEFPRSSPPFQHLFCDDEGRLFVMTYEAGEGPEEYVFDIFTPDGIFFSRASYEAYLSADPFAPGSPTDSWMIAKRGRLYVIHEKPNGYKELMVYRMIWK